MKKAKLYLVQLPVISITIFFICCIIAALIHPGSHKEIIHYQSDYYSFTHNFLSELGSLKTNTDETNPAIIQEDNTPSMLLFNGSLITLKKSFHSWKTLANQYSIRKSLRQWDY